MTQHTPEPWSYRTQEFDDWGTVRSVAGFICQARNPSVSFDDHIDYRKSGKDPFEANARRIVACVNACEGINPEAVPELLIALQIALDHITGKTLKYGKDRAITVARAAMAKATRDAA